MKKHIAGFILFCFIVAAIAFASKVLDYFTANPKIEYCPLVNQPPEIKTVAGETKANFGAIDKRSPVIRQAFFNLESRQVSLEMLFPEDAVSSDKPTVKLSYFRNNSSGLRFIASESVKLTYASFDFENNKASAFVNGSYAWLHNLDTYDNLYVIAEIVSPNSYVKKTPPVFDPAFAAEVVLFYGKTNNAKKAVSADR